MTGVDCSILVQLALPDHPVNPATVVAVQSETAKGNRLVFPPQAATEFLHASTDPRRFAPPRTMTEALDRIEDFMRNPTVSLLLPTDGSLKQTLGWLHQLNLGRKRILDTELAAILYTGGVRRLLTSNPADFTVFNVFDIVTP